MAGAYTRAHKLTLQACAATSTNVRQRAEPLPLYEAQMETEQFEALMMYVLVGGLIVFMFFIIWDLAKKSKAGRLGTAVLFLTLGLCLFAFLAKPIITYIIETARDIHG
jgi:hypothetical protein